jgi:uncharacterized protein YdhG (YjbR/CyaY superfamily)
MGKVDFASVDDYIASQPADMQAVLKVVRTSIVQAVPDAQEQIKYKMPFYALSSGASIAFAGWKRHYSLYLASERIVQKFKDELSPYTIQKGTISFPLSEPPPVDLIRRIAKFRAEQNA